MVESDRVIGWVRALIAYAIWTVVVLVVWRVVLSLESVQMSGFALEPFRNEIYIGGLPWVLVIDLGFYLILMMTALALGGRLKREISRGSERFSRFGSAAYLIGVLGAVAIGYYALGDFILPVLDSQGVEWAYDVLFLVLAIGTAAAILFEILSAIVLTRRSKGSAPTQTQEARTQIPPGRSSEGSLPADPPQHNKTFHQSIKCPGCGKLLPAKAKFCGRCGAKLPTAEAES